MLYVLMVAAVALVLWAWRWPRKPKAP